MNKLKQVMISKIHGLPWEEAMAIEMMSPDCKMEQVNLVEEVEQSKKLPFANLNDCNQHFDFTDNATVLARPHYDVEGIPITLSRVLQALYDMDFQVADFLVQGECLSFIYSFDDHWIGIDWKLLKEDKSTATLEDQSPDTIQALESIFLTQENFVRAEDICLIDLSGNGGHAIPNNSKNINPTEDGQ